MSTMQTRVADDGLDQFVLDRLEISKKLDRADFYIHKVQHRLKQLERKRDVMGKIDGVEDVSEHFDALNNNTTVSKDL